MSPLCSLNTIKWLVLYSFEVSSYSTENETEILKLLFSEWALALAPAALNYPSLIKISKVSTHVLVYQLGQNVEEIQLAVEQSICSESLISYFVCN